MASRAKSPRVDEDTLDPVEAADLESDELEDGLILEDDDEDGEDDELEDGLDDDAEGDDPEDVLARLDGDTEVDEEIAPVVLPDAAFDEDDDIATVVVDPDEDDEDDVEGVRDGEFVCRRCHMAKRDTQLADPEALLCRDCA